MCDEARHERFVAFDELEFVRCAGCSTVFKTRERPGLLAPGFYEQSYFQGRRSGRERRFDHRVRKAAAWISDALECADGARRLLDVGCSLGYVIAGAQRLGLSAAGVDVSAYAVQVCRERGYETRVGSVDALPFDGGAFDIVVLKHVLEHTITPRQALAEVRRVLTPHGTVLIAVPDVRYWKGQSRRTTYRYYRPDDLGAQHHVYYSAITLARLLTSNGFRVRYASKAIFRQRHAARSAVHRAWEAARYAALSAWVGVARTLRLQREVYMVASKIDSKVD